LRVQDDRDESGDVRKTEDNIRDVASANQVQTRDPQEWCRLADVGRQFLVCGQQLNQSRFQIARLTTGDVSGEILDMELHPYPVGSDMLQWHVSFLYNQEGPVAVRRKCEFIDELVYLAHSLAPNEQPPRGLTRLHAPGAFPSGRDEFGAELSAETQIAFDFADPEGQSDGIGECRPHIIDVGIEAALDAHDALTICRTEAASDWRVF
jgi:hypothetical protein